MNVSVIVKFSATFARGLIKKLKADLIKKSKKTDYELDISYFGDGKNYERIEFTSAKFDKGYICFEFQSANTKPNN